MPDIITQEEFEYLNDLYHNDREKFHKVIYDQLDIEAHPSTMYDYYDYGGNYIGNSNDSSLHDILSAAYIKIRG